MDTNDLLHTIGTASSINHPCCTPLFGQVIKIQMPKKTDYKYTNTLRPVKVHQKVPKFGEN